MTIKGILSESESDSEILIPIIPGGNYLTLFNLLLSLSLYTQHCKRVRDGEEY